MPVVLVLAVTSGDQHKRLRPLWPSSVLPPRGYEKFCLACYQIHKFSILGKKKTQESKWCPATSWLVCSGLAPVGPSGDELQVLILG